MDNIYPVLLEQLICTLAKKGTIDNKFSTEEEFICCYLNNINKLNKEQTKVFINFILENIEVTKNDINGLNVEKLKDIFNNFNDININNYSLSNINNFIKNLDNTSVLRYVMENNNNFTKLLNSTCYEFFKKLILNDKYINNSSVLKEIVDKFNKFEQETKNKIFCKLVINIDNINVIKFFKKFDLTKQNEFLLYLFENSENENLDKAINFFNKIDSNYIKNNFLLYLISNKPNIINKIIKKDNNFLKKIIFNINKLNKTQINNLNQILLYNKEIFNDLSEKDFTKIIPNISYFNNELRIIIINKLQEYRDKDKILKNLIFNINIFNLQQQENISLILSNYKEIFMNFNYNDFTKLLPNIYNFNDKIKIHIINCFDLFQEKEIVLKELISNLHKFNHQQKCNINEILSLYKENLINFNKEDFLKLIPNLYYFNEDIQNILAKIFDNFKDKLDIIKTLIHNINIFNKEQKKIIFGIFYLNFEFIINNCEQRELKQITNNIGYFDKRLQNLIIDQNINNLNDPNKPIKHFISNLSLIKDKRKINYINKIQKKAIFDILKNKIKTIITHPVYILKDNKNNTIILKTYITNKNWLNFEIEINGNFVKKLKYSKDDIISLNDFNEYALLFDKNIINNLKNNYNDFIFNDLNLINYLQKKDKKLKKYMYNNANSIRTNQLISYTYRNSEVANGEKRNFLLNLNNIEPIFFKENENYRLLLKIHNKFYTIIDNRIYTVNKNNNDYILGNSFKCNINIINFIKNQFYKNNYNYLINNLNKENFRLNQTDLLNFESNFIKNKDKQFINDSINYIITTHPANNINELIENLQNLFEIINNFKKFETYMIDEKYETKTSGNAKFKLDEDIYFSTDHHGDMSAFLYSLLKSGVAKFKDNERSYIFFDMETGKTYEDYEYYIINNKHNKGNLIPIPNLEINLETKNKFVCGGDIIDRGCDSDSVFCLMYHLLHQKGGKNKINILLVIMKTCLLQTIYYMIPL